MRKSKFKLRALKKLGGVVTEDQRKKLVEGVVLSRLHQHLEVVSMGRKVDIDALQRVQNQAMMWIGGEGRRAFRINRSLDRLGWLDIGQTAAKATILSALKVIKSGTMQDLLDRIAKVDKKGVTRIRNVSEEEFRKMNPWKRKSWSTRVRRWLKMIPQDILEGNPWERGTKVRVKEWVKENVKRRGADSVLWGRWEESVEWEECEEDEEKVAEKRMSKGSPKDRNPPTSSKQMRKLGEPRRKVCRIEKELSPDENNTQDVNSDPRPKPGEEGTNVTQCRQKGNKRQRAVKRKEEFRKKKELKAKEKKEKAAQKEKNRREREEALRRKGAKRTKNQPKILEWFKKQGGEQKRYPMGGRKGVG